MNGRTSPNWGCVVAYGATERAQFGKAVSQ
ncbi:MAG: hypothetical protein QOD63_3139 [Actinomycetota bacterium]|jgi:hypothetical protein|nr:hypothetical protein [Actinomycetota bacterium]